MEWNGSRAAKADEYKAPVYLESGTGNSEQINALLKKMLEMAKIRCVGFILGTVDHGVPVNYRVLSQFNQYIVLAEIGTQKYFLNATDPMRPYNYPDENDLAQAGFLLQMPKGGWVPIPNTYRSSQQAMAILKLEEDGEISGRVIMDFYGYYAVDLRTLYKEVEDTTEFWEAFSDEEMTETELTEYEIIAVEHPEKPLKIKYKMRSGDIAREAGTLVYLDPMMAFTGDGENPFLDSDRKYDIEMGCLHTRKVVVNIYVPEGYEIESLPKATRVTLPDKSMMFYFNCQALPGQIQLVSEYSTGRATYGAQSYPALKQVYDHMYAKQREQIVLRKLPSVDK